MKNKMVVIVDGVKVEYTLLFTACDEEKNKEYVIYTDNKLNDKGETNIYLARHQNDKLLPVSSDEKKELEKLVKVVQEEVCNDNC